MLTDLFYTNILYCCVFHAAADFDAGVFCHFPNVLPRGLQGRDHVAEEGPRPLGVQAVLHFELVPFAAVDGPMPH